LDVKQCDIEIEPLPFADDHFDLILLSEVLEHLRIDLISTIKEIHRVLKPGGYLLCSSPNFLEFRKLLVLLTRGKTVDIFDEYNKLHTLGHMGHVREYTARDVKEFMTKMGFRCEKTIYRGMAEWRLRPWGLKRIAGLVRAAFHRLLPVSRSLFMLILIKE
jgi:SAM-dependent methyltransferase